MTRPLAMQWDGESMTPIPAHRKPADEEYVIGERYIMEAIEERSAKTHRHYFACVNEAWANLPESAASRYPTPDHLRAWALIRAGYRDERSIVCASRAEALRVAAFVRVGGDMSVVTVSGAVVTEYRAKSQSMKAMDKETFAKSKADVLAIMAGIIGVEPAELQRAAA